MLMNDGWSLLMIEDDLQAISPSNVYTYIYNTWIKWRHEMGKTTHTLILSPCELSESVGVSNFIVAKMETLTLFLKTHL